VRQCASWCVRILCQLCRKHPNSATRKVFENTVCRKQFCKMKKKLFLQKWQISLVKIPPKRKTIVQSGHPVSECLSKIVQSGHPVSECIPPKSANLVTLFLNVSQSQVYFYESRHEEYFSPVSPLGHYICEQRPLEYFT
jgi:hypothetical protein